MNALRSLLDKFLFSAGVVLLFSISLAVAFDVTFRYLMRNPIMWMGELATIGLVWMVFLCSALAVSQKANLRIELLIKYFPSRVINLFNLVLNVFLILLFLLLVIIGTRYSIVISKAITGALRVSQAFFYSAVPVSAFFMLVYEIITFYENLKIIRKKDV